MSPIRRRTFLYGIASGAVALLAGCAQAPQAQQPQPHGSVLANLAAYTGQAAASAKAGAISFPEYVTPAIADAYTFALERPDVLRVLPCYCGCGLNAGHRNNLDCFVLGVDTKGQIAFDDHASYCQTCLDIARDGRDLLAAGKSLPQIRREVDARHGGKGPGTDTPPPAGA